MPSVIRELWYGNIHPAGQTDANNEEMKELLILIDRNDMKLKNTLNKEPKETFEKYKDAESEYSTIAESEAFTAGFSLGLKIACEAFIK